MSLLKKLFSRSTQPKAPDLATLVNTYGRVLGEGLSVERDLKELPYSKATIKGGLLQAIEMTSEPGMREQLKSGFVSLADFQDLDRLKRDGRSIPNEIIKEGESLLAELKKRGL